MNGAFLSYFIVSVHCVLAIREKGRRLNLQRMFFSQWLKDVPQTHARTMECVLILQLASSACVLLDTVEFTVKRVGAAMVL